MPASNPAHAPDLHARKLEALGRLSGCIAHDFNNLLTVILGATGSLLQTPPQGDPTEAIREIHDSALRARQLTRQLLAASRPDGAEPLPLDVAERLQNLLGLLNRLMGDRMEVRQDLHSDLPPVLIDPGHLDQVLINLAVNARDAMASRGTLEVRALPSHGTASEPSGVSIQVQDTGTGMDRETQRRIFDPFFTTKESEGGTGLGLATVRRIVEGANGRLTVESEPGQGTRVELWLPAAPASDPDAAVDDPASDGPTADSLSRDAATSSGATPTPASAPARMPGSSVRAGGGSPARILLVEDDPSVRRLIGRVLRGAGYQVREAAGMEQAIGAATSGGLPVHLVVADLMLPDGSGLELLEILRGSEPEGRRPRTILMSGYTRDEVAADILANPEVRFLAKPFEVEELVTVVREALEGHDPGPRLHHPA